MKHHQRLALIAVAATCLLLSACSGTLSEAELLVKAKEAAERRDYAAANVQVQTALQQNPQSGDARMVLARILVAVDQPALAVVELRKALDLGQPEAEVLPLLAQVMLKQSQAKALISEFSAKRLSDPRAQAELSTAVASAYFNTGKPKEAEAALQAALAAKAGHAPAVLLQAQMAADNGNLTGALAMLDGLLQSAPQEADAWRARGDMLLYGQGNVKVAIESYAKALEVRPGDPLASKAIITVHLAQGDLAAAEKRLKDLKQALPNDVQTRYFDAQIVFMRGDVKKAKDMLGPVLKAAPDSPWVLVLSGAIEMTQQAWGQAEAHLSKAVRLYPGLINPRLLLARTHLQAGDPARALSTLEPLLAAAKFQVPLPVLTTAAEAYLLSGNTRRAGELFEAAAKLAPQSPEIQLGKARTLLANGDVDAAQSEFVRIAAGDKGNAADLALVSLHLRRNNLPAAAAAIDALVKKLPDDVAGHRLRAELALRQGREDDARASFERCLQIDPGYFTAAAGLAAIDVRRGKPIEARERFEALLKRNPNQLPAQLALARLRVISGEKRELVLPLYQAAVAGHPGEARPYIELVDYLLGLGDGKQALVVAAEADRALPNNLELMVLLARAQAVAGEPQQALATYGKVTTLRSSHLPGLLGMGELQLRLKDLDGAAGTYRKARQAHPDATAAITGLIRVALASGRTDAALSLARELSVKRKNSPLGPMQEGDIELARGRADAAALAYANALRRPEASGSLAALAYGGLLRAGRRDKAEPLANDWLKAYPADVDFLVSAGHAVLLAGDKPLAERRFRDALQKAPNHVPALNNLAYLLAGDKRSGGVELAERALSIQPDTPALLDTLAMALLVDGKLDRAAEVQQRAIDRRAGGPSAYNLSLAKIFLAQGKKDLAAAELGKLEALGEAFPGAAEVARLLPQTVK